MVNMPLGSVQEKKMRINAIFIITTTFDLNIKLKRKYVAPPIRLAWSNNLNDTNTKLKFIENAENRNKILTDDV